MKTQTRQHFLMSVASVIVVLLLMLIIQNSGLDSYYIRILKYWAVYVIFGASFQILYGYSGLLSLGHAGLIAVGAYTVALLTLSPEVKKMSFLFKPPAPIIANVQLPFIPALIIGGIVTAIIGFIIATPALRLGGDYLAMVTMGFSEVIRLLIINMPSLFNGAMGLRSIPQSCTLVMAWATAIFCVFVLKRIENSSFGRVLLAMNEDEIGAEALGISIFTNKVASFVISAFFAGIGGGLLASILGTIDPNSFKTTLTYAAISVVVLGGLRSTTGIIISAGIYTIASEALRFLETPLKISENFTIPGIPGMRVLIFGLMLLLLMLYKRDGMMGWHEFSWDWLKKFVGKIFGKKNSKEGVEA